MSRHTPEDIAKLLSDHCKMLDRAGLCMRAMEGIDDPAAFVEQAKNHAALLAAKDAEIERLRKALTDVLTCINETRGRNADEAVHNARQLLKGPQ